MPQYHIASLHGDTQAYKIGLLCAVCGATSTSSTWRSVDHPVTVSSRPALLQVDRPDPKEQLIFHLQTFRRMPSDVVHPPRSAATALAGYARWR